MKQYTKLATFIGLLSILVFPKLTLAAELSTDKFLINHNEDGSLKEGFVEKNPWDDNFKSFPVNFSNNLTADNLTDTVIYSEEEAQNVFEDLQKQQSNSSPEQPVLQSILSDDNTIATMALKSKTWYRTEFKAMAVAAGTIKLPTAGNYLNHSLQDKPSHRFNNVGSSHANALSLTKMYTTISQPMA